MAMIHANDFKFIVSGRRIYRASHACYPTRLQRTNREIRRHRNETTVLQSQLLFRFSETYLDRFNRKDRSKNKRLFLG